MSDKNKYGRVEIDGHWYRLMKNGKPGVELLYANHTMTKSELFSRILGFARQGTRFWLPARQKLLEGQRKYRGSDKRIKYEYQCELCLGWFLRRKSKPRIELDHISPCGGIKAWEDIVSWYQKAYVDTPAYIRLCSVCHQEKTNKER